jgi:hypothetical protein
VAVYSLLGSKDVLTEEMEAKHMGKGDTGGEESGGGGESGGGDKRVSGAAGRGGGVADGY